jgi:hypothetical protein
VAGMKQILAATFAALLMGVPAAGASPQDRATAPCPLSVTFGSYAMGIDSGTYARVDRLLARDRGVRNVDRSRWGREGEVTLCVTTRTRADSRRLFTRIKALFPRKPRGPLTVETASGLSFHAPRDR